MLFPRTTRRRPRWSHPNESETQLRTISGDGLKKWIEAYSLGKFAFSGEAEAVL